MSMKRSSRTSTKKEVHRKQPPPPAPKRSRKATTTIITNTANVDDDDYRKKEMISNNFNSDTVENATTVDNKEEDEFAATTTTTSQIVDEIAELCELILENPQQAFSSSSSSATTMMEGNHTTNVSKRRSTSTSGRGGSKKEKNETSKMDQLLMWARGGIGGTSSTRYDRNYVAQLAIMSLLVIYKDIIPSYRIRLPTSQEMTMKVSREVQQLWDYERTLLNQYQQYLILLQNIWDMHNKGNTNNQKPKTMTTMTTTDPSSSPLGVTCILSMAELLKATFHFNFRSNLLTAIIRQMNYSSKSSSSCNDYDTAATTSSTIRTACCDAIKYVFANDHQGDVTLEATRQISKYMKDRNYKNISVQMLQTLYYIPLRVHVDEATAAKIASKVNKKKRKRNAEMATIESEIKEGSTTVDKIVLATCQSDTLELVIVTYFRILKNIQSPPNTTTTGTVTKNMTHQPQSKQQQLHVQELLPTALEGLAKFAHLINIDTVIDLLHVLRDLLTVNNNNNDSHLQLPVNATLNCILTAFQTLHGPGKEMKIDMKEYIIPLYNQIPRIVSQSSTFNPHNSAIIQKSNTELLLQCLTMAFIQRREYSNVRIAAFMKQILTVTLHCASSTDQSIPLLAFVRQITQRYNTALQQLFENEQDVITEGQYRLDVSDPEHANPYATSGWECTLLQCHYNSQVRSQAMDVATCKALNLPIEDPTRLHNTERNKVLQHDLYIPFVRQRKRHPLAMNTGSNDGNKNTTTTTNDAATKKLRTNVRFITPRHSVKRCKIQIEPKMN